MNSRKTWPRLRTEPAESSSLGYEQRDMRPRKLTRLPIMTFARIVFNAAQYASLLTEYIHPVIEGLSVSWVPVNPEGTDGLGIIEVPPQNPERQYFLIANAVDSGSRIRQFVFGIVRRNESSNDPFTIAQLYQYTQKGKSSLAQTLTRIEDKLDIVLTQGRQVDTRDPEEIYAARAARILNEEEGL